MNLLNFGYDQGSHSYIQGDARGILHRDQVAQLLKPSLIRSERLFKDADTMSTMISTEEIQPVSDLRPMSPKSDGSQPKRRYDRLLDPYLGATKQDMSALADQLWRLKMALERFHRIRPYPHASWKHTITDLKEKTRVLADNIHKRRSSREKVIQLCPLRESVYKLEDMADEIVYAVRWKQQEGSLNKKPTNFFPRLRLILKFRKTQELLKDVQVIIEDFHKEYRSEEEDGAMATGSKQQGSTSATSEKDHHNSKTETTLEISADQKDCPHVDEVTPFAVSKIAQLLQAKDIVIPFADVQETDKDDITVYDIFQDEYVRDNFGLLLRVRASDKSVSHQGTLTDSILKVMNSNVFNTEDPFHAQKCGKCRPCLNTMSEDGRFGLEKRKGKHDSEPEEVNVLRHKFSQLYTLAEEGRSGLEKGKGKQEFEPEEVMELQDKFSQLDDGQEKFLLVLEDVMEDQLPQLVSLLSTMLRVNSGSRIVLSSQSSEVIQSVRGIQIRDGEIKHDIHGKFFSSFAFRDANEEMSPTGEKMIGHLRKIPFPFAAKMVGKLLSKNHDHQFRAAILGKLDRVHAECEHLQLSSLLKICYDELQAPLRLCFQYCSLFHDNKEFTSENIVQLWMSQGFLDEALVSNSDSGMMNSSSDSKGVKTLEDLGNSYLEELCSRSFLEKITDDGPRSLHRLHVSVHGFARFTSAEEFVTTESHILSEQSQHIRHLSVKSTNLSAVLNVDTLFRLRTLIISGPINRDDSKNLEHILMGLKNTRTLVLDDCDMKKLPKLANDLRKHLRYLSICNCIIEKDELPIEYCEILNLQVLNVQGSRLKKLPQKMTRLRNLRHISGPTFLTSTMNHIGKLKALQELEEFAVSRKHKIQELGSIKDIRGSISITNLERVKCNAAARARLHEKNSITSLKLEWSSSVTRSSSICGYSTLPAKSRISAKVLEHLKPNTGIHILEINRYTGGKYPSWFSAGVFENLESITLRNCKNLVEPPPFGELPALKRLMLETWDKLTSFPHKEGTADLFQTLVELSLKDMPELKDWEDSHQSFLYLKLLTIRNCPKLKSIPLLKSSVLEMIHLEGCQELSIVGEHPDAALYLPSTLLHLRITACGKTKEQKALDDVTLTSAEGGLTSLLTVHVDDISLLKPHYKGLISLEELVIEGGIGDSIDKLIPKTKSGLRKLCLIKCQDQALPKDMKEFSSLKCFHLKQCDKMESLPNLPYSLVELRIDECPLLEKHCRESGPGFSDISHIPYKYI